MTQTRNFKEYFEQDFKESGEFQTSLSDFPVLSSVPAVDASKAGTKFILNGSEWVYSDTTLHPGFAEGTPIPISKIITGPITSGGYLANFGGNPRGDFAVDLQMGRINDTQVASGNYSTVSGGRSNTASGNRSTVSGGCNNTASEIFSTVSGGANNTASGYYSTVSGGSNNTASGNRSTVSGGYSNTASGYYSTVSGGGINTASGSISTVSGGSGNTASGSYSTVSGGGINTASGNCSTVSGGCINTASGYYSTVSGGINNTASGNYTGILGGLLNHTCGCSHAFIVGSNICANRQCSIFVNNISIMNIPTSDSGLPAGSVWNDSGTLKIV